MFIKEARWSTHYPSDLVLIPGYFANFSAFNLKEITGTLHRFKKWGRIKIERELKKKDITGYCLKMGFQEIDDEEYLETLTTIITKKNQFLKAKNEYERKVKLAKYAMTKGYESHLVWEVVNDLISKK